MRTGTIIGCILLGCAFGAQGCAESELAPQSPQPLPDSRPPVVVVADSFDRYEGQDEATRPPPRPRHTVSLGFVGDEPLSNSVMRDTPIDPQQWQGQGQTWQQYIQTPSWPPSYRPPTYNYYPYAPYPNEYGPPRACVCAR